MNGILKFFIPHPPKSMHGDNKEASRAYLGGVVELLQGASRPLPATDVHAAEGVPPHD